jgi:hypothetical protein
MRQLLFADLTRRTLSSSATGDTFTFPALTAGDNLALSLRFLQRIASSTPTEVYPKIRALRASIGFLDQRPTKGSFALKVGDASSTPVNTTSLLSYAATPAQVRAALGSLQILNTDTEVTLEDGSYLIRCTDGQRLALTAVSNTLFPTSFGRIFAQEINGQWLHELRLVQAPLAHSDSSMRVLPQIPHVATIQDGYTSPDGLFTYPEIQQLTLPPDFRGTYQFKFEDYYRTDILDTSDGPTQIEEAINKMLAQIGPDRSVSVTNPTTGQAVITFGGEWYRGVNVEQLQVLVASSPPGDPTVQLDLDTAEVWTALRASSEVPNIPLEIELDILSDNATGDDDLEADFRTVKIQSVVTLKRAVFFPGLTGLQNVDWLRHPAPRDYVPFTPSQIITGSQHYGSVFGDGVNDTYSFPHNLGTSLLHVTVRQNGEPNHILEPSSYTARLASDNELVLQFAEPVEQNGLAVVVSTAGPVTAQNIHTHTIAQIVGLQDMLEDIGKRLAALERMLPRPGAASAGTAAAPTKFQVPAFGEILPDFNLIGAVNENVTLGSQLIVSERSPTTPPAPPKGTDLSTEKDREKEAADAARKDPDALQANMVFRAVIPAIGRPAQTGTAAKRDSDGNVIEPEIPQVSADPALWPRKTGTRLPALLQAVPASIIEDASNLPSEPGVYRNTSEGELLLPGEFGRRDQNVPSQGLFAFNQGSYYRVRNEGENIYYPMEFERELWRLYIGPDQFPSGAVLNVSGELRTRLVIDSFDAVIRNVRQVDLAGQLLLICEAVELADGPTMGAPLQTLVLGRSKLTLSPALETMRWQLQIRNDETSPSSSWTTYVKSTAASGFRPPAVLRLRLGGFDVDDLQADAGEPVRGQIALVMPQTKLEVTV